uniref:Uncharacterized protein n=1 Tax=Arundo donax TaxID=35708 RepID=A0A0A8Y874_ARUDO
MDCSFAFSEFC